MKHITKKMVQEAINSLPNEFDSHDVEHWMLKHYREAVALEIIEFIREEDMLWRFSFDFGRFIRDKFAGQIRKSGRPNTETLRGTEARCQGWKKIK